MTFLDFVLVALSSICFAEFLSSDVWSGPWDILHKFRAFIKIEYDEDSDLIANSSIAKALLCYVCGPIWLSAVLVILMNLLWFMNLLLIPFAVGGLVILLESE